MQVVVDHCLLLECTQGQSSLIQFFFFVCQNFVMMGQSIADVTVIVFFVAGSPLQEHLEVSFRTVRAHISFVRFKVLEAHIGVLGF
jgi:hypothetical protein